MKIILSPARKLRPDTDCFLHQQLPEFLLKTQEILDKLQEMTDQELKNLWGCSQALADQNIPWIRSLDLQKNLSPALFAYEGIAYRYLAPNILEQAQLDYLKEHLYILSAFYGVLRPFDGVRPYRLEMQAKFAPSPHPNLYSFWGDLWAKRLSEGGEPILNLASQEYSKGVSRHLSPQISFVTCQFGELKGEKIVEKGTQCKMCRGQMVRWLSQEGVEAVDQVKEFGELGFSFCQERSTWKTLVFLK